jgi:transcriptional regulator with XRE-family HTH domain
MLKQALTTTCCRNIVTLLTKRRGWSIARVARVVNGPAEYIRRIQNGMQSFQVSDVEALARACKTSVEQLIFDSIEKDALPVSMHGLYDLAVREAESHAEFKQAIMRKPKKRRARKKAA